MPRTLKWAMLMLASHTWYDTSIIALLDSVTEYCYYTCDTRSVSGMSGVAYSKNGWHVLVHSKQ